MAPGDRRSLMMLVFAAGPFAAGFAWRLTDRLRRSLEASNRFFELSVDLLCTATFDGRFQRLSPSWERLGWTLEELRSRPFVEFIHPDDRERTVAEIARLTAEGAETVDFVNRYRCRDGSYRTLLWAARASSNRDLIYATAKDVTDRHEAERAIRESQQQLQSVLDHAPAAIYIKDLDGRYVLVNRSAERFLGAAGAEVLGRTDRDLLPRPAAEAARASDREVLDRGEPLEVVDVDRDDRTYVTIKFPLFDDAGEAQAVCAIARDITEHERARIQAAQAREEAERANRAKNEFLSRMSHELRTPLNAILGFGQLLAGSALTADQRDGLAQITSAGRHLLELIDEVLDIAAIESGRMRMSLEPVDLEEAVVQALDMVRPMASTRDVQLPPGLEPGSGGYVVADRQRLKQVLLNLLANAVKYNRRGGDVRVACEPGDDGRRRLTVTDTGIGIAAHDLDRVFAPFERLGAERSGAEGTGLGLTLTKRLVEAMGGEIRVRSTVGSGTTFSIELPAAETPPVQEPQAERWQRAPGPLSTGTRTVLLVEDNPSNVKLVESVLAQRRHVTLLTAMQGSLALELAVEHRPSLVLLDLNLPDMPGEEVLRRMRADPRIAATPIVVVSADATDGQIERLRSLGATDYLTKPYDIARLLSLIDAAGVTAGVEADGERAASGDANPLKESLVAQLRELASGSEGDRLDVAVGTFLEDAARRIGDLDPAVRAGDGDRIAQIAHSLAGSSSAFGAQRVAELSHQLGAAASAGDLGTAAELSARLEQAFVGAAIALRREFPNAGRPVSP